MKLSVTASAHRTTSKPTLLKRVIDSSMFQFGLTFFLSQMLVTFSLGLTPGRLWNALATGDGLFTYSLTNRNGTNFNPYSAHIGFPQGFDEAYFPYGEKIQSWAAWLISQIFDNVFFGWNLVYALSFSATALTVLTCFRVMRVRGEIAVGLSLAASFIPFSIWRIEHIALATLYPLAMGVLLSLLIVRGDYDNYEQTKSWTKFKIFCLPALIGFGGIYWSVFSLALAIAALIWRIRDGQRVFVNRLRPVLLVAFTLLLSLTPSIIKSISTGATFPKRDPIESVAYAGQLVDALLPNSESLLPLVSKLGTLTSGINQWANAQGAIGVRWIADQGSVFVFVAFIFVFLAGLNWFEPKFSQIEVFRRETFRFLVSMIVLIALSLVPFGFSSLIAVSISPQIRAYDRLIPLLQILLIITLGQIIEQTLPKNKSSNLKSSVIGILIALIIHLDTGFAGSNFLALQSERALSKQIEAAAIVKIVEKQIGVNCAILQLPNMTFPESAPLNDLAVYEPLWLSAVSKKNAWSYGGVNKSEQSNWLDPKAANIESEWPKLADAGYCGAVIDKRGYTADDFVALSQKLESIFGYSIALTPDGSRLGFRFQDNL